uniref:Uncharacterized protein n=1 Tax=Micrurus surinamensis TaxID=129470 RepID=A0A2D4NVN8_MICSU
MPFEITISYSNFKRCPDILSLLTLSPINPYKQSIIHTSKKNKNGDQSCKVHISLHLLPFPSLPFPLPFLCKNCCLYNIFHITVSLLLISHSCQNLKMPKCNFDIIAPKVLFLCFPFSFSEKLFGTRFLLIPFLGLPKCFFLQFPFQSKGEKKNNLPTSQ